MLQDVLNYWYCVFFANDQGEKVLAYRALIGDKTGLSGSAQDYSLCVKFVIDEIHKDFPDVPAEKRSYAIYKTGCVLVGLGHKLEAVKLLHNVFGLGLGDSLHSLELFDKYSLDIHSSEELLDMAGSILK